jgi:sugar/nucleoside kinase (ribokinase family)
MYMERRGIISMGNWLVDSVKFIDVYPAKGNLVTIRNVEVGLGGCSHNVLVDLARLESGMPLYAGGCIGRDDYGQMVQDAIRTNGIDGRFMTVLEDAATSYTDVMSEINGDVTRTFFHCRGANARLTIDHIRAVDVPAKIFHLGYLLLLDQMDKEDAEYGVVAARALKELQEKGYETSVDVVSEEGDRFRQVVLPCLPYTDYLIVNEVEAGACCNMELRDSAGVIDVEGVRSAAEMLIEKGVRKMCVIHFPEGGFAMAKDGSCLYMPTDMLPKSDIVSAVGAGDAFCAGTLYALHEGFEMEQMLRFANTCARFNLSNATSTGGAPSLNKINEYLGKGK